MGWGHFLVLGDRGETIESFLSEIGQNPETMAFHLYGVDDGPDAGRVAVLVGSDCGFSYTCTVCGRQRCPGCGDGGRFDEDAGTMTCDRCAGDERKASLTLPGAVLMASGTAGEIKRALQEIRKRQSAKENPADIERRLPPDLGG